MLGSLLIDGLCDLQMSKRTWTFARSETSFLIIFFSNLCSSLLHGEASRKWGSCILLHGAGLTCLPLDPKSEPTGEGGPGFLYPPSDGLEAKGISLISDSGLEDHISQRVLTVGLWPSEIWNPLPGSRIILCWILFMYSWKGGHNLWPRWRTKSQKMTDYCRAGATINQGSTRRVALTPLPYH